MFDGVPQFLRAGYKQILGIGITAVILFVIIVPFQSQQSLNAAPLCGLLGGHDYGPCPQSTSLISDTRNAATAGGKGATPNAASAAASAAAAAASKGASSSAVAAAAATAASSAGASPAAAAAAAAAAAGGAAATAAASAAST